ncbi:MAG: hypothetical protein GYA51_08265 [Candidatus Methanofastidiosa archaeon]|jgi:hypothetical protein|nr:hypothetical protein [Candidatus Methanofastidiosa archaeon]
MKRIRPFIKNSAKVKVLTRYLSSNRELKEYIEKLNPVFYEISFLDCYVEKSINEEVKKTLETYEGLEITTDEINDNKYIFYIESKEGEPVIWMKNEDQRIRFSKIPVELS